MPKPSHSKKYIPDYTNPKTLENYAVWYYRRYLPSIWKLKKKLLSKNNDVSLIESVLEKIKSEFNEDYLISLKVNEFLRIWKSEIFIKNSLWRKLYDKAIIEKYLKEYSDKDNWKLCSSKNIPDENEENLTWKNENSTSSFDPTYLENKILNTIKNKSIRNIKNNLEKSWFSKENIDYIIKKNSLKDDSEDILNIIDKLRRQNLDDKKILKRMIWRGYKYDDLKNVLNWK